MSETEPAEPTPETDESAQRSDETHEEWTARNAAAAGAAPLPEPAAAEPEAEAPPE